MPWTLCTKEDVISIHPTTLSELKDEWSVDVEALIRQYLGEQNLGLAVPVLEEYHNGDGTNVLMVRRPKIISVEAIYVNGIYLSASDYVIFDTYIQLKAQHFPVGSLNVRISYTSGSPVDDVTRFAAAAMIVAILNYKRRWGSDASLKWGSADTKMGEDKDSPNYNVGLTSHLTQIMKRLLRRNKLRVY